MKQIYNKEIIKKLLTNSLEPNEWKTLLENKEVSRYMYQQWSDPSNTQQGNPEIKRRIWKKIEQNIEDKKPFILNRYYRFFLRATAVFLILVTLSTTGYFLYNQKPAEEIIVNSGIQQIETVILPDGSIVKLGPGSTLKYSPEFSHSNRSVSLNGQAFFDVHSNPESPFTVNTDQMNITVSGTAFEVFDYAIENQTEAILLEGTIHVRITNNQPDNIPPFTLLPNDKISFNKENEKITLEKVNADTYSAWRQGNQLNFENEKLSMIIPRLEQWYGKNIICNDTIAEKYRFKFKVKNESLEKILSIMEYSSSLRYQTDSSGNYILYE